MASKTLDEASTEVETYSSTSVTTEADALEAYYGHIADRLGDIAVYKTLVRCQEQTGVFMHEAYHSMPTVLNADGHPIALFEFVEVLDGAVDYDEIGEELKLTYTQIDGAMTFLRRVSMINPQGFDADQFEMELDAQDPELLGALREGSTSQEGLRVLDAG